MTMPRMLELKDDDHVIEGRESPLLKPEGRRMIRNDAFF